MKKRIDLVLASMLLVPFCQPRVVLGQSTEAQQLLLNAEKLSQLKNILEDMKKGYQVISQGYNTIRDISSGNFSLHQVFIDGLLKVNPELKKYARVAEIISTQQRILSEYKAAYGSFQRSGSFGVSELSYLNGVYAGLSSASLKNLDDLLIVLTGNSLRASDGERLEMIDKLFLEMRDLLFFLREFNRQASLLNYQRSLAKRDLLQLRTYFPNTP